MRHELWAAILACSRELDRLVAAQISDRSSAGPPTAARQRAEAPARTRPPQLETAWRGLEPEPRELQAAGAGALRVIEQAAELERGSLTRLQLEVRAELDALWSRLQDQAGFERVRKTLLIYFDERIMGALPDYLRLSWPLLQTEATGSTTGGVDFYRFIDDALDDPKTPSLVFEVEYFCLRHGFCGRYAKELAQIDDYERRLLQRIERPQPRSAPPGADAAPSLARPWPVWSYYLIAVAFVVGFAALLSALSNREPRASSSEAIGGRDR